MKTRTQFFTVSISVGLFLVFALSQISLADIIILKNGRRINGDIIGESPTNITVKSVVGTTTLNRNLISEILKEEQEVNHIRNGDYYMDKGEYAAATTEYAAALRLNPNLIEVEQKLNEAKSKLAQSTIDRLAPAFAQGDRLLSKGFYDDAVKSFRDAIRTHPEPEYQMEANRKIEEVCRALIAKGDDYSAMKNYNPALEMYAKVTIFNSGELAMQSSEKMKGLSASLFGEGDAYLGAQDLVKASQGYQQIAASYPGNYVDAFVKEKMKQLSVRLRYKPKAGDQWKYKMSQKNAMKLPMGGQNMPQSMMNMDMDFSTILLNKVDKIEGDEIDLVASLENVKASTNFGGTKQNLPIPNLQQKSFAYSVSNLGKPIRTADLSSITGEGMLGTESMYAGVGSGYLTTLPQDTVRVGDKWIEPINQQINLGSMGKMNLNGRIRYTLLGFENMAKFPCAKIEGKFEDIRMTFSGNMKPTPDQPAQPMNMNVTMNGTGTIYFAYNEGKMVRNSTSMNLEIQISMYSGGEMPVAPTSGPYPGGPPMGLGNIEGPAMPPELGGGLMRPPEAGPVGPISGPAPGPTPMQQTGQMKISGTVISDIVLVD
ncbi:MAG: hypothetical protein QME64_00335 [bacterium]|nr:hypothetical protein [bacterium]